MAKTTYKDWEAEEKILLLQGWARNGLTNEQIASNMDIVVSTLWEWRKKSPKISNALKIGKDEADIQVENALYKAALEGNTTAMIFWLKIDVLKNGAIRYNRKSQPKAPLSWLLIITN